MGLCGVAIIAGFLFKATGRFKLWQIFGLCIRIIGYVRSPACLRFPLHCPDLLHGYTGSSR